MRDYSFRGKRKDNGEWVEGYYLYRGKECGKIGTDVHYIVTHDRKQSASPFSSPVKKLNKR